MITPRPIKGQSLLKLDASPDANSILPNLKPVVLNSQLQGLSISPGFLRSRPISIEKFTAFVQLDYHRFESFGKVSFKEFKVKELNLIIHSNAAGPQFNKSICPKVITEGNSGTNKLFIKNKEILFGN